MLLYVMALMIVLAALFDWTGYDRLFYAHAGERAAAAWAIGFHNEAYEFCTANETLCNAGDGPILVAVPQGGEAAYAAPAAGRWNGMRAVAEKGMLFSIMLQTADSSGNVSMANGLDRGSIVSQLVDEAQEAEGSAIAVGSYDAATNMVYFSDYYVSKIDPLNVLFGVRSAYAAGLGIPVGFAVLGPALPQGTPVLMSYIPCDGPQCGTIEPTCAEGSCPEKSGLLEGKDRKGYAGGEFDWRHLA